MSEACPVAEKKEACVKRASVPAEEVCVKRATAPAEEVCVKRASAPAEEVCVKRASAPAAEVCVKRATAPAAEEAFIYEANETSVSASKSTEDDACVSACEPAEVNKAFIRREAKQSCVMRASVPDADDVEYEAAHQESGAAHQESVVVAHQESGAAHQQSEVAHQESGAAHQQSEVVHQESGMAFQESEVLQPTKRVMAGEQDRILSAAASHVLLRQ